MLGFCGVEVPFRSECMIVLLRLPDSGAITFTTAISLLHFISFCCRVLLVYPTRLAPAVSRGIEFEPLKLLEIATVKLYQHQL